MTSGKSVSAPFFQRIALFRALRALVPKRYIVVHGYYGVGNVGDEAILAATLEEVRRVTDLETFVFAWGPEQVREDFGVPALNPNRSHPLKTWFVLLQSRAYLLGGGGLIKDYGGSPASLARWLRWPRLAHALGVKTMLWSVGVENVVFEESKALLRDVLAEADAVTLRDPSSAARLREIGVTRPVEVTADPVPHYARNSHRKQTSHNSRLQRVVVCPRHWYTLENAVPDEQAFDVLLSAFAQSLDDIGARYGSDIVFVPFRTSPGDDDRVICDAIADRMKYPGVVRLQEADPTVQGTLEQIASADLVIAMRLHAAVMATSMGIPTVAVSYMPKVGDYMASIGQDGFCTTVEAVSARWLSERADAAAARYEELSAELEATTAELSGRFLENGRILADLLSSSLP